MCVCSITEPCPTLFTPWTIAGQAPLSIGFSSKNTGVGSQWGIFPTQGLNPHLLCSLALAGGFFTTESPESPKTLYCTPVIYIILYINYT